jgi:hypothetical protein
VVDAVYYYLLSQKMNPWMDKIDFRGGHRWKEILFEKINSSTGFVFCLSNNSKERLRKKAILFKELMTAKDKALKLRPDEIFLIPLSLDGCKIPKIISDFQVLTWDADKDTLVLSLRDGLDQHKRRSH